MQRPAGRPSGQSGPCYHLFGTARAPGQPQFLAQLSRPSPTTRYVRCSHLHSSQARRGSAAGRQQRAQAQCAARSPAAAAGAGRGGRPGGAAQGSDGASAVQPGGRRGATSMGRDAEVERCAALEAAACYLCCSAHRWLRGVPPGLPASHTASLPRCCALDTDGCQDEADGGGHGQPGHPVADGADDVS